MTGKKLPAAVLKYFQKEGSKGGKLRSKQMTAKERSKVARKAAWARWSKAKKSK